jgi:hypothetical protein
VFPLSVHRQSVEEAKQHSGEAFHCNSVILLLINFLTTCYIALQQQHQGSKQHSTQARHLSHASGLSMASGAMAVRQCTACGMR